MLLNIGVVLVDVRCAEMRIHQEDTARAADRLERRKTRGLSREAWMETRSEYWCCWCRTDSKDTRWGLSPYQSMG